MKTIVILLALLLLLCGCARSPMVIEYYPPSTPQHVIDGHGPTKLIDYRKPNSGFTLFGISVF